MKNINDIAIIVQARLNSERVPKKMIRPFAGSTLVDIFCEKIKRSKVIKKENFYLSIYEKELIDIAEPLGLLQQNPEDYLKTGVNVSSDEIDKMIAERSLARAKKDFKEADRIRDELQSLGVVLEDSNNTTTWRRA